MADWRKIWSEISDSERFHSIPERSRLGYLQAYPHTDREGRLPWSAKKLRAMAFPMTDWTESDVEQVRSDLVRVALWIPRKDSEGQEFVEVWRFEKTQGARKRRDREPESKFGDPIDLVDCVPGVSKKDTDPVPTVALDKIRLDKRRGEESTHTPPSRIHEWSGARNLDARLITPAVEEAWRQVHPSGDAYVFTQWDRLAITNAAHALQRITALVAVFRRAYDAIPEGTKKSLERAIEKLNEPSVNPPAPRAPIPLELPPLPPEEQALIDERIRKINEGIARRDREAAERESAP